MAKSDAGDIALGVLGALAGVGAIIGLGYAGAARAERLEAEYNDLSKQKDKLENRRFGSLTLRDMRKLRDIQDRMEEIEDAFGL